MPSCRYLIYQGEIANTGKKHWQGYVEFSKPVSRKKVQEVFKDPSAHCEVRLGTREQARDYCRDRTKQTFTEVYESGDWAAGGQGQRTDLQNSIQLVRENKEGAVARIATEQPETYVKYHNGLTKLDFVLNKGPEWRDIATCVLYGSPGGGKSKLARDYCRERNLSYYSLNTDRKEIWYDGYMGEPVLIIDDLDDSSFSKQTLKKVTDGHRYMLPIKGGFTWAHWVMVIITSEHHPSIWWQGSVSPSDGLWRRLTIIHNLD